MVMLDGWLFIQSSSSAFLKLFDFSHGIFQITPNILIRTKFFFCSVNICEKV